MIKVIFLEVSWSFFFLVVKEVVFIYLLIYLYFVVAVDGDYIGSIQAVAVSLRPVSLASRNEHDRVLSQSYGQLRVC